MTTLAISVFQLECFAVDDDVESTGLFAFGGMNFKAADECSLSSGDESLAKMSAKFDLLNLNEKKKKWKNDSMSGTYCCYQTKIFTHLMPMKKF